jgi:hypothetical protein
MTLNSNGLDVSGSIISDGQLSVGEGASLVIAAGAITVTHSFHEVVASTPGSGSDTLNTINGGVDGAILVLRGDADEEDTITLGSSGNILPGTVAATIKDNDTVMLIYSATTTKWHVIANNAN